ncbi:hypothetical protein [Streptosporangium longisporum]|uniref:DUF5753 domain-containing protein n=1 Tax=Streptosporangium longisporum TaxID=46187 RepID=A0ABN3XRW9_9ACTN
MELSGEQLGDYPPALLRVLTGRSGGREQVVELDMRVRFDLLQGVGQGQERGGAQRFGTPLDPQGVDDVEEVRQRQVAQP